MSISNTPYDDAFRTLLIECPRLVIPIVNELFGTDYTGTEKIILLQNEHFITVQEGGRDEKITDAYFIIKGKREQRFHIECQSTADGSIIIRMFEYDVQIAIENSKYKDYRLEINFPDSAVLFLRHNKNTPDFMEVVVNTKGGSVLYKVPVLKAQTYSLSKIFEKKLYFLLPFYIFCYEKQFDKIEEDEEKLYNLKKEYSFIIKRLNILSVEGGITEYEKLSVIDMMKHVMEGITAGHSKVRKETIDVMGGKVLEYEARTIKNEAYAAGQQEGYTAGQQEGYKKGQNDGIEKGAAGQIIRILKYYNRDDESIIHELVNELDISVSKAQEYLKAYN